MSKSQTKTVASSSTKGRPLIIESDMYGGVDPMRSLRKLMDGFCKPGLPDLDDDDDHDVGRTDTNDDDTDNDDDDSTDIPSESLPSALSHKDAKAIDREFVAVDKSADTVLVTEEISRDGTETRAEQTETAVIVDGKDSSVKRSKLSLFAWGLKTALPFFILLAVIVFAVRLFESNYILEVSFRTPSSPLSSIEIMTREKYEGVERKMKLPWGKNSDLARSKM